MHAQRKHANVTQQLSCWEPTALPNAFKNNYTNISQHPWDFLSMIDLLVNVWKNMSVITKSVSMYTDFTFTF